MSLITKKLLFSIFFLFVLACGVLGSPVKSHASYYFNFGYGSGYRYSYYAPYNYYSYVYGVPRISVGPRYYPEIRPAALSWRTELQLQRTVMEQVRQKMAVYYDLKQKEEEKIL